MTRNVGADGEVVDEVGVQDSSCGLASREWWGWWGETLNLRLEFGIDESPNE